MGLRIKTNVDSLIAQRKLSENSMKVSESLEKLSSGQRINKSADDAAGLAVSERMRARTRSLEVAKRNANDGISYIQVAEGGLNEVTNIVVRMRELASQAASDTIGNRERTFLDKEFQQLRSEVGRIVESTEFNGSRVLSPEDNKPIKIFVGASNRASDANGDAPEIDEDNNPDVVTIDLADLDTLRQSLGDITEQDIAVAPEDLEAGTAEDLGPEGTEDVFNRLDTALNSIASYRATLGSVQSRLGSTITNIDITNENLNAAVSRIRDVDYASETAKFTQARILQAAGMSVMSHTSSNPEMVLSLLK
ncbi:MAG: flagellin [Oligoflexales bacterium]|nr:flagellin [Oligoflexales bacterium]